MYKYIDFLLLFKFTVGNWQTLYARKSFWLYNTRKRRKKYHSSKCYVRVTRFPFLCLHCATGNKSHFKIISTVSAMGFPKYANQICSLLLAQMRLYCITNLVETKSNELFRNMQQKTVEDLQCIQGKSNINSKLLKGKVEFVLMQLIKTI